MKIQKTFIQGRMNKDLDERILPDGEYPHAENIQLSSTDVSDIGVIENVRGNERLTSLSLENAVTIGGYADTSNQKLYWFVTSNTKDLVVEYDFKNKQSTVLLSSTSKTGTLKFNRDYLITSAVKVVNDSTQKDILAWTDDINPPRMINIERAKTYGFDNFNEDDISVIKKPPFKAPLIKPTYTTSTLENNLENKFLLFGYRYVYADNEKSAISTFSSVGFAPTTFDLDYQTMENKGMKNAYNAVDIIINTGDSRVKEIEIVFKACNSNTIYLIDSFKKSREMWGDNEEQTIKFSNSKKYIALPEDELYRSYDNVPLLAKVMTLCGNRFVYGNYVEGYDLKNIYGEDINMDYNLSLISKDTSGVSLPSVISNRSLSIDLSHTDLSNGSRIRISINLSEPTITKGSFSYTFDYVLTKNYSSVQELNDSDDFTDFVENVMTNVFRQRYTSTIPNNYDVGNISNFTKSVNIDTLVIVPPSITYIINDDINNTTLLDWMVLPTTDVSFSTISVTSSLKSNRSYEVGIIYKDDYKRASTVLTDINNTLYIPQSNSVTQNKLGITINHQPPYWAKSYNIVVKQNKANYYNIYTNFVYRDGLYAWFKLEGSNKDKLQEGDYIILKADNNRIYNDIMKYQVLEIKDQPKNFLSDNTDLSGEAVEEQAGLYFKIKMEGFTISSDNNKVYKAEGQNRSENKSVPPSCYVDLFSTEKEGVVSDLELKAGTRIVLKFDSSFNYKNGWSSHKYDKSFLVLKDYDNIKAWADDELSNKVMMCEQNHDYKNGLEFIKGDAVIILGEIVRITPNPQGKLWMKVLGHETGGSGGRGGFVNASITVITSEELFFFETEPKDLTEDIYYETSQTFDIENNLHKGNVQNQTSTSSAVIELDFFNCYTQGNGVESYQYMDLPNSNYLNIDTRPCSTSVEKYKRIRRSTDITYSEPYNENNNVNGLNEFNLAKLNYKEDITKEWGSIQKMRNRNNDLLLFQEDKVSYVLFGKDMLMNADGSSNLTSINNVFGQQIPYGGEFGISRVPESHSFDGHYDYWQDPKRGVVCRLGGDGISTITSGMTQYFKDVYKNRLDSKLFGANDPYTDNYVISITDETKDDIVHISCSDSVSKSNFHGVLKTYINYGELIGECGFSYTTNGEDIEFYIHNGDDIIHVIPENSMGQVIFDKTTRNSEVLVEVVSTSLTASFNIDGICITKNQLKVIMVVYGGTSQMNKTYNCKYNYKHNNYNSPSKTITGVFDKKGVIVKEIIQGVKGDVFIPLDNSSVTMTVTNLNNENLFKGGKFGYLLSDVEYNESNINGLLTSMITVNNTESFDNDLYSNKGIVNLNNINKSLYLVYQYQDLPIAVDDISTVEKGGSVQIPVLNNDLDVNGGSVIVKNNPYYGSVNINNNVVTYQHNGNFLENDLFTYVVKNSIGESNEAVVNIEIKDIQLIANDDYTNCEKGSTKEIDVLYNDIGVTPNVVVVIDTPPSYGTVNVDSNNNVFYTHNNGEQLQDSFSYHMKLNNSVSNTAIVHIDIAMGCDSSFTMSGGTGSFDLPISYGTAIGECGITYNMYSVPDKAEIIWDGNVVATTTTEVSGTGTLLFIKDKTTPTTAIIRVSAPTEGTVWNVFGVCPNVSSSQRLSNMLNKTENINE